LDGYPRTGKQAELFLGALKKILPECDFKVINFIVSDEEVLRRISTRFVCDNEDCQEIYRSCADAVGHGICDFCGEKLIRREDDSDHIAKERIRKYPLYRDALLAFYGSIGQVVERFNVESVSINQVFENFKNII
jgi:adenylate kinase